MSPGRSDSGACETAPQDCEIQRSCGRVGQGTAGDGGAHEERSRAGVDGGEGEDQRELDKVLESARTGFNDAPRMSWGGGIMGPKSQAKARKRDRELQKDLAQRLG